MVSIVLAEEFGKQLVKWQDSHDRSYPWIGETNPYRVLLSEFLLQQTRSDQALPYYDRFLKTYPTILHLAQAGEADILNIWQGLGYYNRGRNLHKTARIIVDEYHGIVPEEYEVLIRLPGIGLYTAAAISSFAFGKEHAVVDGNVIRVLARVFNISIAFNSSKGKSIFHKLAKQLIKGHKPAVFNQGIMNLGAEICTPKNYNCTICPLRPMCYAYKHSVQHMLPQRARKTKRRNRFFHLLHITYNDGIIIEKRTQKDIWQHLYQFPLIETSTHDLERNELLIWIKKRMPEFNANTNEPQLICNYKQTLTHQIIHAYFYKVKPESLNLSDNDNWTLVNTENLVNFAFPKTISWYLEHYSNFY